MEKYLCKKHRWMLKSFRWLSILEGISFLLILFITMPLKYIWDNGDPNKVIGMAHGFLFLAYVVMAVMMKPERNWSNKTLGIVLLCSIIPFGTFWMDKKYLRD
jgi:integral membrane protein